MINSAKWTSEKYHEGCWNETGELSALVSDAICEDLKVDSDIFFIEGAELDMLLAHPLCAFVPGSVGVAVRDSIAQPVVLLDGMIIDGRMRVREAARLALPCPCRNFDADRDGHPAMLIARAAQDHHLTTAQKVVMAVRLVNLITHRPDWLDEYDLGLATRMRKRSGREPLLRACGISTRTYQRMHGIQDEELLQAVSDERVPLREALALRELGGIARRRIFDKPRAEQRHAIDEALQRHHHPKRGSDERRAQRVFSWTLSEEPENSLHPVGKPSPVAGNDDSVLPSTGEGNDE